MAAIALTYGVSEPAVHRTIGKIEAALLASGRFSLPGKKALREAELAVQVVVVDATEVPTERPKKQRRLYSGKKKRHTHKAQVLVSKSDKRLLCTAFAKGKTHDFTLFKDSRLPLLPTTICLADSGYKGLQKHHENSRTPQRVCRKS